MKKKNSLCSFIAGWFCPLRWDVVILAEEESGGGPEKKQDAANQPETVSSPTSEEASEEAPKSEAMTEDVATEQVGESKSEVTSQGASPQAEPSDAKTTKEQTDFHVEMPGTEHAEPGDSRRMLVMLGVVAALLIVVGVIFGKDYFLSSNESLPTKNEAGPDATLTPEHTTSSMMPSSRETPIAIETPVVMPTREGEPTPTPTDTVTQTVTPPPSAYSAEPGDEGQMQATPTPASGTEGTTSAARDGATEPENTDVATGMDAKESDQKRAETDEVRPSTSPDMHTGTEEGTDIDQKALPTETNTGMTKEMEDDAQGTQSTSLMEKSASSRRSHTTRSGPEWILPIWRAPLDDGRPLLPDYRVEGRHEVFPGDMVTAWLARTGQSGIALGTLPAYLALPGDVIPANQGSIALIYSPAAGIVHSYSLPNPAHVGPGARPVLAGYLLDSAGFDAAVNGAFRLVLNPVQRVLAFAVRRPGGIFEARWNYPNRTFADDTAWHTIVVFWGNEGMGIMVDGIEVAYQAEPVRLIANGPWFLGHGRPFGPDGPRSMMGRYKDVAVYNEQYPFGAPK